MLDYHLVFPFSIIQNEFSGSFCFNYICVKIRNMQPNNFEQGPKNVSMKNAVMMLNEMFPPPSAPQYKVLSMTGDQLLSRQKYKTVLKKLL